MTQKPSVMPHRNPSTRNRDDGSTLRVAAALRALYSAGMRDGNILAIRLQHHLPLGGCAGVVGLDGADAAMYAALQAACAALPPEERLTFALCQVVAGSIYSI